MLLYLVAALLLSQAIQSLSLGPVLSRVSLHPHQHLYPLPDAHTYSGSLLKKIHLTSGEGLPLFHLHLLQHNQYLIIGGWIGVNKNKNKNKNSKDGSLIEGLLLHLPQLLSHSRELSLINPYEKNYGHLTIVDLLHQYLLLLHLRYLIDVYDFTSKSSMNTSIGIGILNSLSRLLPLLPLQQQPCLIADL